MQSRHIVLTWEMIGWDESVSVKIRDLWAHSDLEGTYSAKFQVQVEPHSAAVLTLTPVTASAQSIK